MSRGIRVFLGAWVIFNSGVSFAAVEYIFPAQIAELKRRFAQATKINASRGLADIKWSCDMYGARTNLQVERNVPAYIFTAQRTTVKNSGAHLVSQYEFRAEGLVGQKGQLIDEVRLADSGELVAQLSLREQSHSPLAISVCHKP